MTQRAAIEHLLLELYAARVRSDLAGVCATFAKDAYFQVGGASNHAAAIAMHARGAAELRPLLAILIKSFKLTEQKVLAMLIDGTRAAVHWQARVHSRITGTTVLTELVDVIEVKDGRITSYIEFFVPR
jgi:ketosteroid isomerase-like protein